MSSKDSFSGVGTERYARALYELALENSEIEKIESESKKIFEIFKESFEFRRMVKDPTYKKTEQLNVVKILSDRLKLTKIFSKSWGIKYR